MKFGECFPHEGTKNRKEKKRKRKKKREEGNTEHRTSNMERREEHV